jgi:hypothetical protein
MSDLLDIVESAEVEYLDEENPFFPPASADIFDGLLGEYGMQRRRIESLAERMADPETRATVHYFLEGNQSADRGRSSLLSSAAQLFCVHGAVAALNGAYWSKALALTNVLDMMPQKRRREWHESIMNPAGVKSRNYRDAAPEWDVDPLPDFTEGTVRNTITDLLNMRSQFLAERVDGIFSGLSGEHVTNSPEAFGKRMILARVLNEYHCTDHNMVGLINDLRCVVAKFMGRDEPPYMASEQLVKVAKRRWGQWVNVDGGAMKLRVYKKGTAHMEVHPDMAWRLNQILAYLHPLAIPAQFRQRPLRRAKVIERIMRPLPFAVLDLLASMTPARERIPASAATRWQDSFKPIPRTLQLDYGNRDKHAVAEVSRVMEALGGVRVNAPAPSVAWWWEFDYEPGEVRDEIVVSGCIPDQKSHQFYPTPERLARQVVELAEIEEGHAVLEPQAGTGGLADLLPKDRTTCVEVSGLHCKVLAAKGHQVVHADFLEWAAKHQHTGKVDRIVMNPPFDRGQWVAHVEHAALMLAPRGRLVAVLPSGAKNREILPGLAKQWHGPFDGEFAGTSVSVVILVAERSQVG